MTDFTKVYMRIHDNRYRYAARCYQPLVNVTKTYVYSFRACIGPKNLRSDYSNDRNNYQRPCTSDEIDDREDLS
jgi:hypothetical protein